MHKNQASSMFLIFVSLTFYLQLSRL